MVSGWFFMAILRNDFLAWEYVEVLGMESVLNGHDDDIDDDLDFVEKDCDCVLVKVCLLWEYNEVGLVLPMLAHWLEENKEVGSFVFIISDVEDDDKSKRGGTWICTFESDLNCCWLHEGHFLLLLLLGPVLEG